jgi:methionyl-tRNA formyltransferase
VRLVYLGTPEFAVPTLERLAESRHKVVAVYTQPDRPKGRGQHLAFSPVKEAALRLGLRVYQPLRIRKPEAIEELATFRADAMVIVGYGQIIPQAILDLPPLGIINVHASLLPAYRGAAPIQWSIANGETRTGVTTMRIDAGLDTGDVLLKAETEIGEAETAPQLSSRLAKMGAELLLRTLDGIESGTIVPQPQDQSQATYAPILKKEDGQIDWELPASAIYNRLRGFQPWPGAYTTFRGQVLHLWQAKPDIGICLGRPGSLHLVNRKLHAACGQDSALELIEVQLEGRKRVNADAFANGQRLTETDILGEKKN